MKNQFDQQFKKLIDEQQQLLSRKNDPIALYNGFVQRYQNPILTAAHTPLIWRYDINPATNPYLMERFGINAVFNAGAIKWNGKYLIVARVEGYDRKSFFAIAESPNGIDNFVFWDYPIHLPDIDEQETNIYDMRLTAHEDGWVYGIFCSEKRDERAPAGDLSSAIASTGMVRTRDLIHWERLPNLKSNSHQRNVVLHPEYVQGKYALYTRPQDGFIDAGKGGGICWALVDDINNAVIEKETLIDERLYHTVKETKNGEGPAPIKTDKGWLHLAHGVRQCAAGLRYTLYLYLTDLHEPQRVIASPAGYFMAPEASERVGDVSNVLFANGWIVDDDGKVFIYYASSDTRMHVATSTVKHLLDYCLNTRPDGLKSSASVKALSRIITENKRYLNSLA
ncbi:MULTISPECIES: glycoside hydrolase family 130 protein [Chitinophagaceae]